ncbi:MAG: hypothetical protein JSS31_07570 [Proteobacteria bacterium]|nr:hypothetical protein [Pseudomonadota bacterium]
MSQCVRVEALLNHLKRASTMKATVLGIDLAKNVFQVRGVNEYGKAVLKNQLKRNQVAEFFVSMPPNAGSALLAAGASCAS